MAAVSFVFKPLFLVFLSLHVASSLVTNNTQSEHNGTGSSHSAWPEIDYSQKPQFLEIFSTGDSNTEEITAWPQDVCGGFSLSCSGIHLHVVPNYGIAMLVATCSSPGGGTGTVQLELNNGLGNHNGHIGPAGSDFAQSCDLSSIAISGTRIRIPCDDGKGETQSSVTDLNYAVMNDYGSLFFCPR
ncbi:hypothetical protein SELMODRAFT_413929 [Selaginella moellendorffii]|uniref:Cyanovirin-N domain-containing protein n=1 Tax=Selaginella moellendorffii TaxID=88036 RepID=D8RR28_SELML|nr:hypothetical protein SELMODRAFT_413929 [Selaginella moellendorffii]